MLSYRWQDSAVAFSKAYSWEAALAALSMSGKYAVPLPEGALAAEFYTSVVALMSRTGTPGMWVDQLCVPQNRNETIDIVHASGDFYKKFEVVVWTPWAHQSDKAIASTKETIAAELQLAGRGDLSTPTILKAAEDVSLLYMQFKRGWILRETCPTCR